MRCTQPRHDRHRRRRHPRRGVAAVLAMMFLILFGSLAAAMAIVSRGNMRTARTHMNVMTAMSAAESGLSVAEARMAEAASRFVIEKGHVDDGFGSRLWTGSFLAEDGTVTVLPPPSGHGEYLTPQGVAQAVANIHAADVNTVDINGVTEPVIGSAPPGTDPNVYKLDGWVTTPAIALEAVDQNGVASRAFQIVYAPLASGTDVRAFVTGYVYDYERPAVPLTRVVSRDFRMAKRVDHAIVSPNRIMIGKNVLIHGSLGAHYTDVNFEHGHPVTLRSDFRGIDPLLDQKIADLYAGIAQYDSDGDGRLRWGHPFESQGIPDPNSDYDGDGTPDGAFSDVTEDGYVDEFDVFINHYDANGDGRVTLSTELTDGTPAQGMAPEFVDSTGNPVDEDLAQLIDYSNPDRNENGVWGYDDADNDGEWDAGTEDLLDYDADLGVYSDQVLGYRDGFIDRRDLYAKISGKLVFRVLEQDWAAAHPNYEEKLEGTLRPEDGEPPRIFDAPGSILPDITSDSFTNYRSALIAAADGASFEQQVAGQLGITVDDLATYDEDGVPHHAPHYYRLDPDANGDGLPDNWQTAYFEKMPFNSPAASDWYYRPVYENMTFRDVQIPEGNNGLFINCTFIGVTLVRSHLDNIHPNWTLYGKMEMDSSVGRPIPVPVRENYGDEPDEIYFPPMLPPSAIPPEQVLSISFITPLDKGDIPSNRIYQITNYDELPDPLLINGKRVTDTKLYSNNIRMHDSLFVGSIIAQSPSVYTHVRNKMQFTGGTRFVERHPTYPDDPQYNPEDVDLEEIAKSSMMLPNYSVDIGTFNSPPTQDVDLRGAIVAGVLDIRGDCSIRGALLLTFRPVLGEGPLRDLFGNPIGNPAGFNATLGYFGPEDGDAESLDPYTLPIVDGVRIVGWDLDGDGLADLGPNDPPTQDQIDAGATPVPFYGFGSIDLTFDPDMIMPDGVMMRLKTAPVSLTYAEGRR